MSITQAITYGLIQGLGEFLPVSSSGHLVLLPWLLNWSDPGLTFDIALHFGTLLAVFIYFGKDFLKIFLSAIGKQNLILGNDYSSKFIWLLIAGTIPGALAGVFLDDYAETAFRKPLLIAFTLSFFGALLFVMDRRKKNIRNLNQIAVSDAFLIGLAQAVAIVPGVSRSGATITAGLSLNLDRTAAARFSFLLSAPIIFGAFILKAGDFFKSAGSMEFLAIAVSAASGYLAIAGLIKFVQKASYKIFFWYRLILAAAIVGLYFLR